MEKHDHKSYSIPPHWGALVLFGLGAVITGVMWILGITSERAGHIDPWALCVLCILAIILEWKSLRFSQSHVDVCRCSILRRRIPWAAVERLEILTKSLDRKYILIELHGCPPCPKRKKFLYFLKHPRKLIAIKLTPNKEDAQIKMIEAFHPIDASISWLHSMK